jgi:hypothetical protein
MDIGYMQEMVIREVLGGLIKMAPDPIDNVRKMHHHIKIQKRGPLDRIKIILDLVSLNLIQIILTIITICLLTSCSTKSNNWPSGMTPFFAECEFGKVYTDNEYHKKKRAGGCNRGEFKYYDRGEPTLTND